MSKEYLEGLMAEGNASKDLTFDVANALTTLAEAEGVPTQLNVGHMDQAEATLVKADGLTERLLAASPHDRQALLLSAIINQDRMILADNKHLRTLMLVFARKSAERLDSLLALGSLSEPQRQRAGSIYTNIALAHKNLHRYDESVRYGRQAVAVLPPGGRGSAAMSIVADSLRYMGDLEGALKTIDQAQASIVGLSFADELIRANITHGLLWRRGVILGADGQISLMRPEEAITMLQQAFEIAEDMAQRDAHEVSFRTLLNQDARELGNILRHQNPERALAVFDQGILRLREIKENSKARRGEAQLLAASSYPLRTLNRVGEAKARIDMALEILRETKDYPVTVIDTDDEARTVLSALADCLAEAGQVRQAEDVYLDLLKKIMASHPDPDNDIRHATALSRVYAALTQLHIRNREVDQAKDTAALRLKIWQNWNRKLPNNAFVQHELAAASET